MEPLRPFLRPCSTKSTTAATAATATRSHLIDGEDDRKRKRTRKKKGDPPQNHQSNREDGGAIVSRPLLKRRGGGILLSRTKTVYKLGSPDSASSSSSTATAASASGSSSSFSRRPRQHELKNYGRRKGDGALRDLALPLGMSFAAIISQVLDGTNRARNQIPIDRLSLICTSAVKESVANIYGDRFDYFLLNFEKSFGSTLRTLRLINDTSHEGFRNTAQISVNEEGNRIAKESSTSKQGNTVCSSFTRSSSCEPLDSAVENFEEVPPLNGMMNNQIVLREQMNHELTTTSSNFSMLSTFEKSVVEQTRSNDLKEFELSLIRRKLHLKESQLALSSYANMLEKIKISMGVSKAFFKEEKLRNQMLDVRHAELVRRCIDLLVAGLIIMSGCLGYGAFIFAYQRITEVTSACSATPKESKSWWIPKPMASFNSGLLMLRCHVVALTRLLFGLLMILAIAYSVFQRSAMSTPTTMPVTFILLVLGFICGVAGKLCVDTLGGSGFHWLLHWEILCLVHFVANIFPAATYGLLYGPISVSHMKGRSSLLIPYWFRRIMFYLIISTVYPALSGLLPFASLGVWKGHFAEKINLWMTGLQIQE